MFFFYISKNLSITKPPAAASPNLSFSLNQLVCGSSPIACVLVECKSQHSGKWEQQQHRNSLDHLRVQHKFTVMGEMNAAPSFHSTGISNLRGPPDWERRHWWAYSLGVGEVWWMLRLGRLGLAARSSCFVSQDRGRWFSLMSRNSSRGNTVCCLIVVFSSQI